MSGKFKVSSWWQTEQQFEAFDRRIINQQVELSNRIASVRADLGKQIDKKVDILRDETIVREETIVQSLKQDTNNKINALEIKQREAMIRQSEEFYQVVADQSRHFSQQLTAQSISLQNQIRDSHNTLRSSIQEQGRVLSGRINDLRSETYKMVNQVVSEVNANFDRQQQQIDNVVNSVNGIIEQEQNLQARANLHVNDCRALLNVMRTNLAVQKFSSEQLDDVIREFQDLSNLEDGAQALTAQAKILKNQMLRLHRDAQKQQLAFDIMYTATLAHAESLLVIMHQNREKTYYRDENNNVIKDAEGNGIRVEIDFWTDGEYAKIEEHVRQLHTELRDHKNNPQLNQSRVEAILAQLADYELRQANLITTAAGRGFLSEERVEISEQIIHALLESGFELKQDYNGEYMHNYQGNIEKGTEADQREGVFAVLKRGEVEITILVNPDESKTMNKIVFQRNDENNGNPEELRHTIKLIREAIEKNGNKLDLEATPYTVGDQRLTELADVNALKKGLSTNLKTRLAGK